MTESHAGDEPVRQDPTVDGRPTDIAEDAGTVIRDQNGQYIEESSGLERVVVPHQRPSGQLDSQDLDSIRAKNVTMNQSGAEQIDAETVTITSGGAKSINATNVELKQSGAVTISGETVSVTQSSAMVIAGDNIDVSMSGVLGMQADRMTIKGDTSTGLLIARNLTAEQDLRAVVGVIGNVASGSNVRVLFDTRSAIALGAGLAFALKVLGRVFRK
jgi:hypothetical protein